MAATSQSMTRLIALATEESVLLSVKLMWSSVSSVTSTTGRRGADIGCRRDAAACAAPGVNRELGCSIG